MKKWFYAISLFLIFMINSTVYAEGYLNSDDVITWYSEVNKVYIASGKKMNFTINGSTSEIIFGSSEESVLVQKERVQSIKVTISSSSGASCTVSNKNSSYYDLNNNVFTLKDNNTETDNLDGSIGGISCSVPTTDNVIRFTPNNYITITLETTDIDIAPETPTTKKETKTYRYQFGVLNESYIRSFNKNTSITSVTVDGQPPQGLKSIEIDKASVTLAITQNGLASKNNLYLNVESEKNGPIIKKELISAGERTINLPYGSTLVYVEEKSEKEIFLDSLYGDESYDEVGFTDGTFDRYIASNESAFLFNRIDNRSKVNTLKSLMISDVTISFNPDLKTYNATVPYKVSSVKINSVLTDSKSSYVKGYGNRTVNLNEGTNNIQIKVQAENESVATYTIKITREKNDDASLKSITVDEKEIAVKEDLLVYSVKVNNEVVRPTIKAVPTDSKAKAEIDKFDDLVEGDNEINITVTASNGTKKVYVINVIRDTLISTNSKLKKLEVKGQDINFEIDKEEYKVHINYDVDKLDLVIEPDHEKAKYIVTGNKDLKNGSVVRIKVTAEDGETITNYVINVEKEKKPFNIVYVIIPAIMLLVGGVIILIKKGKKKKENSSSNTAIEPNVEPEPQIEKKVLGEDSVEEINPWKSE